MELKGSRTEKNLLGAFAGESQANRTYLAFADKAEAEGHAQIAKLFEPFATTKGQKGTGLGLAVSWGIVDNHNGTITVESDEGVGTTFIVRIPVGA